MTNISDLAKSLDTNHSKISRLIKKLEQTGSLNLEPIQNGQSRELTETQVAIITAEFRKSEPSAITPIAETNFEITQKSYTPIEVIETLSVCVENSDDYIAASRQANQHNMNVTQSNFQRLRQAMLMMAEQEGQALGQEVNAVRMSAFLKQQNLANRDLAESLGISSQNH